MKAPRSRARDVRKVPAFHFQLTTFAPVIDTLQECSKARATFAHDARSAHGVGVSSILARQEISPFSATACVRHEQNGNAGGGGDDGGLIKRTCCLRYAEKRPA